MKSNVKLLICCLLFLGMNQVGFAQSTKKVLIEKYTSTSCGSCPDGAFHLNNVLDTTPNTIWVSLHIGWWDPMRIIALDSMYYDFAVGTPMATVDRTRFNNFANVALFKGQWASKIQQQTTITPEVTVDITGTRTQNQTTQITVNSRFLTTPSMGDYRINLYVVEDSIIGPDSTWNQVNYHDETPGHYYQGAGLLIPHYNYPHRNVVRAIPSFIWGTSGVIPNNPMLNVDYSTTYNYTVPQGYDINKLRFVAFVSTYNTDIFQRNILNANELNYNDLTFTTHTQTERLLPATIQIAPNPVQTQLNIQIQSNESLDNSSIEIIDVMGRKIKTQQDVLISKGINSFSLEVGNLNNGLYFLQVKNGVKVITKRFVVQK